MTATQPQAPDFARARFSMVESQLRPNKVRDERVLEAMGGLPREMFISPTMAGIAYIDEDIQVARGRYLLEPMVLARLTEEAAIKSGDRILDIGPATGYSTAVLASMAREVVAVESDANLQKLTASNLAQLNITNARVEQGPMEEGWSEGAPYDVILINGSVEFLPDAVTAQLKEGGRLVTVMRRQPGFAHTGEARLYGKLHDTLSHRPLFDANVKLLPGFEAKKVFTF